MNDKKLENMETEEQKKDLLLVESVTIGGILWFAFQSIAQAAIGFVTLKFLHKWFAKKTAEEESSS